MTTEEVFQYRLGTALVTLQFSSMILLTGLAWPAAVSGTVPTGAWVSFVLSVLIGVWAISAHRLGNFNIRPAPRPGGQLIQQGPYRWIRHPMYTAVILFGLACAWASTTWLAWLISLALVLVLTVKACFEERWMLMAHPEYEAYRQATRRFVPWLL